MDKSPADILSVFGQAQPYTPQAVTLMRESRATGIEADADARAAATAELVAYTKASKRLADQLKTLGPIPVKEPFIVEAFSL